MSRSHSILRKAQYPPNPALALTRYPPRQASGRESKIYREL